jgi:2-oxo-3-hexenedioate decarboxylase
LDRIAGARVREGDVVTTGTVTRAWPVAAGEMWMAHVDGLWLPALSIRF